MTRLLSRGLLVAVLATVLWTGCDRRTASNHPRLALPFIENDYNFARDTAKALDTPLFVELWAPW